MDVLKRSHASAIEIDVQPEWKKILREDGSILWDYHKVRLESHALSTERSKW